MTSSPDHPAGPDSPDRADDPGSAEIPDGFDAGERLPVRLVVLDVNETLSDLAPLGDRFADLGLSPDLVPAWFAGVLRDAFALTVAGEQAAFPDLGVAVLRGLLPPGRSEEEVERAGAHLMDGFVSLPAHPDVAPALHALAALGSEGLRVVTLSNGSAEVGRGLLERTGVEDTVTDYLSVADAGVWKPDARAYEHALQHCGVPAEQALMVAVHPWDLHGAHHVGMRTAWVDRAGRGWPGIFAEPDLTVRDLTGLVGRLSPPGAGPGTAAPAAAP